MAEVIMLHRDVVLITWSCIMNFCSRAAVRVLSLSQAEVAGTVVKACVENGQSVTPGQPLFIIKP
jgi:multidrug resistance efflux pump